VLPFIHHCAPGPARGARVSSAWVIKPTGGGQQVLAARGELLACLETVRIRGRSTARAPGGLPAAPGTDLGVGCGIALNGVSQNRLGVGVAQAASDGLQRDSGQDQHRNRNARLALSVPVSMGAPSETHANDPK
jgi:hypothetical protein